MAISSLGGGTNSASTGSVSTTPVQDPGDVLIVFGYQRATTTTLSVSGTGLTFNEIVAPSGNATYGSFGAWWTRYPSQLMSDVIVTGSSTTNLSIGMIILALSGVDTSSTPLTDVGTITNQASADSYTVTGPTGLSSGVVMIGLGASMDNNAPTGSWSGGTILIPNGNTNLDISAGSDAAMNMTSYTSSGGTCGNYTYTLTSVGPDVGRTLIFGVKPASDVVMPHTRKVRAIPPVAVSQSSRW